MEIMFFTEEHKFSFLNVQRQPIGFHPFIDIPIVLN